MLNRATQALQESQSTCKRGFASQHNLIQNSEYSGSALTSLRKKQTSFRRRISTMCAVTLSQLTMIAYRKRRRKLLRIDTLPFLNDVCCRQRCKCVNELGQLLSKGSQGHFTTRKSFLDKMILRQESCFVDVGNHEAYSCLLGPKLGPLNFHPFKSLAGWVCLIYGFKIYSGLFQPFKNVLTTTFQNYEFSGWTLLTPIMLLRHQR